MHKISKKIALYAFFFLFAQISFGQNSSNNIDTLNIEKTNNSTATFEDELFFDQFCENFKSVKSISELASKIKQADEEFGIPIYLKIAQIDRLKFDLRTRDQELENQKSLIRFTLRQLEEVHNKTPFHFIDFEKKLSSSFNTCANKLQQEKDYRYFILRGYFEIGSSFMGGFSNWLQQTKIESNYKNLFEAFSAYRKYMQSENIRKEKEKNNNTTVVLDKNGERTNNASYKNSRPESFNGIFFNENNLELNRFLYHGENFTHAFSGVARAQSSWDERQQSHVVLKKSTEGMRYATGALVVKNGVSAIAETYGKNISQKIILINKEIETLRVEIKHNKIEQAVVAEKNKISDVDFILKDFHLNMTKDDVKKLIPNSKLVKVDTYDGKEFSQYECGFISPQVQHNPNNCLFTFTYAGESAAGVVVRYWGDYVIDIELFFGGFIVRDGIAALKATNRLYDIGRAIGTGLDLKYPKESSKRGSDPGRSWQSRSSYLKVDDTSVKNSLSLSLRLTNSKYNDKFANAQHEHKINLRKNDNLNKNKKILSDM